MNEVYLVTITSFNELNNMLKETFESENLVQASRVVLAYKPKKGYNVEQWFINRVGALV